LDEIFGRRDMCPYTGECESFKTMVRAERWMERAVSSLRRSGEEKLSEAEGGYHINTLQHRLEHLRGVKKRCYSHHGRCLRFWQFERLKGELQASGDSRYSSREGAPRPVPVVHDSARIL
jgi:hypothetical protein